MRFKVPELKRDQLPADATGEVESPEQLERAVEAIKWLRCATTEVNEALSLQTMPLQKQAEQAKTVQLEGQTYTFAELEAALTEKVDQYVRRNRRTLFDGKAKTLKLQHGEVSLRDTPLAITFKQTKAQVATRIAEHFDIVGRIIDYAKRLGCRPWLKLEPVLDVTAIKSAYEVGELTDEDLAEHGLKAETGMAVRVKPYV